MSLRSRRRVDPYFLGGVLVPLLIAGGIFGARKLAETSEQRTLGKTAAALGPRLETMGLGNFAGHVDAPVRILELTDYECAGCATLHGWTWPLIQEQLSQGDVRYQSITVPLPGNDAGLAAAVHAACVAEQNRGAFWRFHHEILTSRDRWVAVADTHGALEQYSGALGLDVARLRACTALSAARRATLESAAQHVFKDGITGVPVLVVNERLISGDEAGAYRRALLEAIEKERQRSGGRGRRG